MAGTGISELVGTHLYSSEVDRTTGILCDQTVMPDGIKTPNHYPDKICRIKYIDRGRDRSLVFLIIAELYHSSWQVELVFK